MTSFLYAAHRPLPLILCLSALGLLAACQPTHDTAGRSATPPSVDVVTAHPQDIPVFREWIGSLDGEVNATIRPQITGYLIKKNYQEGQVVKKGQTLFEIDPRTFQAALNQAKAARSQQQALHATAEANLARIQPLAAKNAVSRKDLDDAIGAELSARAALEQASAALETAKLNLEFTRITSPIDGIAGIAKAQIGDLLSPNAQTELTTVSQIDPMRVYVSISEQEYLRHARFKGTTTEGTPPVPELILADGTRYPHKGRIVLLDRQAGQTTGTFKMGAIFPNAEGILRPGLFGKLRAQIDVHKGAFLVPQRAVSEIQGRHFVTVIGEGNVAEGRPVQTGERIGSDWVISAGLKDGERIVVEGTQKARPGAVVSPREAPKQDEKKSAGSATDAKR